MFKGKEYGGKNRFLLAGRGQKTAVEDNICKERTMTKGSHILARNKRFFKRTPVKQKGGYPAKARRVKRAKGPTTAGKTGE